MREVSISTQQHDTAAAGAAAAAVALQAAGPFWDGVLQSVPVLLVLANTTDWEAASRTKIPSAGASSKVALSIETLRPARQPCPHCQKADFGC